MKNDPIFEVTCGDLIQEGAAYRDGGQIEALQGQVDALLTIVGLLLVRSGLTDAEILEVTNCEYAYNAVESNA